MVNSRLQASGHLIVSTISPILFYRMFKFTTLCHSQATAVMLGLPELRTKNRWQQGEKKTEKRRERDIDTDIDLIWANSSYSIYGKFFEHTVDKFIGEWSLFYVSFFPIQFPNIHCKSWPFEG